MPVVTVPCSASGLPIVNKSAIVMVLRVVKALNADVFSIVDNVAVGDNLAIGDEEPGSQSERLMIGIKDIDGHD
jgi:hypothetical protein